MLDDDHAVWFADSRERDCFTAAVFNLSDTTSKYTLDLKVLDRFSRLDLLQKDVQLWDIYGQKCLDLENGCVTVDCSCPWNGGIGKTVGFGYIFLKGIALRNRKNKAGTVR